VILEYLKKYRKAVVIRFASSLGLGCVVFFIVIGGILLNPLLQAGLLAFITLLSPTGFGFLLFGFLLITGLLCTALWLGIESYLQKPKEDEYKYCANEEQELDLVEGDISHQTDSHLVALGLIANQESSEEGEEIELDDDSVETFEKKAKGFLKIIATAASQPQTDKQAELEVQWKAFRARYFSLARIYHPDLELDQSRKLIKKEEFQRLSGIYERVQKACGQLKERMEQRLNPIEVAHQERNKLLREMNELLKTHVEMLDRLIKQISNDLKELKIEVAAQQQKMAEHDKKLEEHNQKFAENRKEYHKLVSDLREELKELNTKGNTEEIDETEESVINGPSHETTTPVAFFVN
jgi:chromosome segregation ATPase